MEAVKFEARVGADGDGIFFEVPDAVAEQLGDKARPPVVVRVNQVTYRSTLSVYSGRRFVPFRRELRERAGLEVGDMAMIELAVDDQPRTVEVPADFADALTAEPSIGRYFDSLAYSHRKEYVEWVGSAKLPETRARRISQAMDRLRATRGNG